ncbi:hypothetical protein MKW98_009386 [Papaver atlanticum]|uniref:Uncharacterized protein n=1 Tax=Papaver atlanticum TaxID=357466 RepID=A0AAD4X668_9MAGN|nr:hypothetical protein MKW98_009386 [Papaver atlanticum]
MEDEEELMGDQDIGLMDAVMTVGLNQIENWLEFGDEARTVTRWYQNQYWWLILVVMPWLEAMVAGDGRLKELQRVNWLVVIEMYAGGFMGLVTVLLIGNGVVGVVSLNGVAVVRSEREMNWREFDHADVDVTRVQWNQVEENKTDDVERSCMNVLQEKDLAPPIEYFTCVAC